MRQIKVTVRYCSHRISHCAAKFVRKHSGLVLHQANRKTVFAWLDACNRSRMPNCYRSGKIGADETMMNYIWGGMLIIGIIFGVATGNMQAVTDAVLQSSREAVTLGISMLGIVAFWTGLMEVAQEAGVITGLTRLIAPFMRFLFPDIPKGHRAWDSLSANFVANILGLGWAATPAGLRAMSDLEELERARGNNEFVVTAASGSLGSLQNCEARAASNEMCTFLVMNISSLQLIPVNIIAYRSQYGSANPAAVIAPAIVATFFSTVVAVVYCKVMGRKQGV